MATEVMRHYYENLKKGCTYESLAGLNSMRDPYSARYILCEDHRGQTVDGIVGHVDYLLLLLKFDNGGNGPEDLLPDDLHRGIDVCEDGRFDEVACVAGAAPACEQGGSIGFPRFDVSQDSLCMRECR